MSEERRGTMFGLAAYLLWGLFPLFWPLLEPAGALEILAHRVVWSLLVVTAVLVVSGNAWRRLPRGRRPLGLLTMAAALIAVNWGLYIWGVNHHHVVETSLGYFVNPLVTVALSVVVLRERLRRIQWIAVAIAAFGVLVLTIQAGRPPWIALGLAVSFGSYGLIKKVVGVEPAAGLAVETAVLAPVALGYLLFLGADGTGTFTSHGAGHALLLAAAGPVTALPLLLFAAASSRVPLSRMGLMQYVTPSIQFMIGVVVRHEPLPPVRLAGFLLVWVALVVFAADSTTSRRRQSDTALDPARLAVLEPRDGYRRAMIEALEPVDEEWSSALAIVAHPDDLEYGAASAIARWTSQGKQVTYCLATRGEAGIDSLSPDQAGPLREQEQRASAAIVGVSTVEFLDYPDGTIEYGLGLRRDVARLVRRHRPDVVITANHHDSWGPGSPNQADHIAVGRGVLDGVRDASNRWVFPELASEGLEAWHARWLLVSGSPMTTHAVDVTDYLQVGIASLEAHGEYLKGLGDGAMAHPGEFLESIARSTGTRLGCRFAVGFEVIGL